jgi:hypothetical protein
MTAKPDTFEADPEAARLEAVALYGEEVVAAAEAAFDESCLLELALKQTDEATA